MPQISYSEVKLYRKCPAAHDYKYRQKLKKKKKSVPLLKGSILHDMLNALVSHKMMKGYDGPDPWDVLDKYEDEYAKLFAEEQEEYGDLIGECAKVFEGYISMYKKDDLKYEYSEEFVATDLTDEIRLIGYIDKIALDSNKRRWLMDHKFVKKIPDDKDRFSEIQLLIYFWAWERWTPGKPIDGIIWDYGRTKVPATPELLKSGVELSKRKNIDTDARTYKAAIKKHGLDPDDYLDILDMLEGREATFFQRYKLPSPTKRMIDMVVEDFKITAVMINRLPGIAPRHMNKFNCNMCDYRDLCEAEVRGHDAAFIKKAHYVKRKSQTEGEDDGRKASED